MVESNRCSIRHRRIEWAYGARNTFGIPDMVREIKEARSLEDSTTKSGHKHLLNAVQDLEEKTVRSIVRTINLLADNHELICLSLYLPPRDMAVLWDFPYDADRMSGSTVNLVKNYCSDLQACFPQAVQKLAGIKQLVIGYTKNTQLFEKIAEEARVEELTIALRKQLNREKILYLMGQSWEFWGSVVYKRLGADSRVENRSEDGVTGEAPSAEG